MRRVPPQLGSTSRGTQPPFARLPAFSESRIAPGVEVFGKSRRASGSPPDRVKVVFLRHLARRFPGRAWHLRFYPSPRASAPLRVRLQSVV